MRQLREEGREADGGGLHYPTLQHLSLLRPAGPPIGEGGQARVYLCEDLYDYNRRVEEEHRLANEEGRSPRPVTEARWVAVKVISKLGKTALQKRKVRQLLAKHRARPWLMDESSCLTAVVLLPAASLVDVLQHKQRAQMFATCSSHPNVATLLDWSDDDFHSKWPLAWPMACRESMDKHL